jgi:hypothetical protein
MEVQLMLERRREPDRSEVQVSSLPQTLPISELITKSKPAIFRKAEDVKLRVVHELRGTMLLEVPLDVTQVLWVEVCGVYEVALGGFVVVAGHGMGVMRPQSAKNTPRVSGGSLSRWTAARYAGLSRKAIQRHRDVCPKPGEEAA